MTISPKLMQAILAMDSYNRGYNPGIAGLGSEGVKIGLATVGKDASQLLSVGEAQAAGFYAVAYDYNGSTVISYRGTDQNFVWPWSATGSDLWNGWGVGVAANEHSKEILL